MKQKVITSVIKKRFTTIREYINLMLVDFEEEAIHDFRTEIKKFRAFLRLLNTGHNKDQLNISKKIKVYYWYAGSIRNLQLHIKSINEIKGDKPSLYIAGVKKQVESLQGALRSLHSPSNFDKQKKMIHGFLKPCRPSVKKFVSQKVDEFNGLLVLMNQDEILHAIRKLLKDLLYNWKYIKSYRSLLPIPISTKKQIKTLTEVLGEFCDRVTGIQLLEANILTTTLSPDKNILQEIISEWVTEKTGLRSKLYSLLHHSPA